MIELNYILDNFKRRHDVIHNLDRLKEYVIFLINYKLSDNESYLEKHHILPVCTFPEFKNAEWNIIPLTYEDHKTVHKMLFESINIRQYEYPLKFMLDTFKDSEKLSIATKIAWTKFKTDKAKYNSWLSKRSEHMKTLTEEEQRRRANIFWQNISEEERKLFSQKVKDYWTDEKKKEKSNQMKFFYTKEDNILKKSKETKQRWAKMSEIDRENFCKKMSEINNIDSKKRIAGNKIRTLWKDEEYLQKMKKRRTREGVKIKLIDTDGHERIFDTMRKMSGELKFSTYLIRKYRDTQMTIQECDLNTDNVNLLGSKIETI